MSMILLPKNPREQTLLSVVLLVMIVIVIAAVN